MLAVKRSTASTCARKSRSSRCVAIAIGRVRYLSSELSWKPRLTSGAGAPPSARYSVETTTPLVRLAIGRSGARSRTRLKSNGLATVAIALTGSEVSPARASIDMMPPRHHPTSWTGASPLSSETRRIAVGSTSGVGISLMLALSSTTIPPKPCSLKRRVERRGEELQQKLGDAAGRLDLRAVSDPIEQLVRRLGQRVEQALRAAVRHHTVALAPDEQHG